MTTQQLRERVEVVRKGYCTYYVMIKYRGHVYSCFSNNSLAYDRIQAYDEYSLRAVPVCYTYKGALESFYDECKRINRLGEYDNWCNIKITNRWKK